MPTIRDVANHCGVSAATVSHVLNGRVDRVGSETRDRVLAAVRALQYRPPAADPGPTQTSRRNIAIVCGEMSPQPVSMDHYFSRILDGVLEAAASRGYSLTIVFERMWAADGSSVRQSYDGHCDGAILLAPEDGDPLLPSLAERGANVTVIGSTVDSPGISCVDVDNEAGAYAATRHLIGLGHRQIAYLGASPKVRSSVERQAGYERAMRESRLSESIRCATAKVSSWIAAERRRLDPSEDAGPGVEGWGEELIASIGPFGADYPTAFFCWNDDLARSATTALIGRGMRIPEDVSVIGFDDCGPATAMLPHLTVMAQPLRLIGKRAADLTIDRAENRTQPVEVVRYAAELVTRDSTGPVRIAEPPEPIFICDRHQVVSTLSNGGSH